MKQMHRVLRKIMAGNHGGKWCAYSAIKLVAAIFVKDDCRINSSVSDIISFS